MIVEDTDNFVRGVILRFWGSLEGSPFDRELTDLLSRHYAEGSGRLGPLMGELLARAIGTMVMLTFTVDDSDGRETLLTTLREAIGQTYTKAVRSAEDAAEVARAGGLQ